jgi:hypothetical protein
MANLAMPKIRDPHRFPAESRIAYSATNDSSHIRVKRFVAKSGRLWSKSRSIA